MLQTQNFYAATKAVSLLRPAEHSLDVIEEKEVGSYHDAMRSSVNARTLLSLMEPTPADLRLVRVMLAAELSRPGGLPRLSLVIALLNKHEKLYSASRIEAIKEYLPMLAVELEKAEPVKAAPTVGAELQAALTAGLHET